MTSIPDNMDYQHQVIIPNTKYRTQQINTTCRLYHNKYHITYVCKLYALFNAQKSSTVPTPIRVMTIYSLLCVVLAVVKKTR
jgi:hypothetical protein